MVYLELRRKSDSSESQALGSRALFNTYFYHTWQKDLRK